MASEQTFRSRRPAAGHLATVAAALVGVCICGCGEDGYRTSIVTGTVSYQGRPAGGLCVSVAPVDGPRLGRPPSMGITDADGRYRLVRPRNKPGAAAGPATVTFSSVEDLRTDVPFEAIENRIFEIDIRPGSSVHDFDLGSTPDAR